MTRSSCSRCSSTSRWPVWLFRARRAADGPYYIVNYDDRSGRTDGSRPAPATTSKPFSVSSPGRDACPPALAPVLGAHGRTRVIVRLRRDRRRVRGRRRTADLLLQVRPSSVEPRGGSPTERSRRRSRRCGPQGRAAQPAASLPARQPLDLRRHARLESGGDHRPAALAAVVIAVP